MADARKLAVESKAVNRNFDRLESRKNGICENAGIT